MPPIARPASPGGGAPVVGDTSRLNTRANLDQAGQQFEALFTQMMLKAMRSPHLADDIFASKAADSFRDLQDQRLAVSMAAHQPIGIGKAMVAFLAQARPDLSADDASGAGR